MFSTASKICSGIHRYLVVPPSLYQWKSRSWAKLMFLKCARSSDLQAHLNTSVDVPCNFTLETYACAQVTFNVVFSTDRCQNRYNKSLHTIQKPQVVWFSHRQENFTAPQLASLLKCNLPGNSSHSRMIWKMLLTKSIMVLDPALDILANMVSLISALWKAQIMILPLTSNAHWLLILPTVNEHHCSISDRSSGCDQRD